MASRLSSAGVAGAREAVLTFRRMRLGSCRSSSGAEADGGGSDSDCRGGVVAAAVGSSSGPRGLLLRRCPVCVLQSLGNMFFFESGGVGGARATRGIGTRFFARGGELERAFF